MDIKRLRERLDQRRGHWSQIARAADIDRRTISRIMGDPEYLPTLRTMLAIERALASNGQSKVAA